jgi:hypothetical protein
MRWIWYHKVQLSNSCEEQCPNNIYLRIICHLGSNSFNLKQNSQSFSIFSSSQSVVAKWLALVNAIEKIICCFIYIRHNYKTTKEHKKKKQKQKTHVQWLIHVPWFVIKIYFQLLQSIFQNIQKPQTRKRKRNIYTMACIQSMVSTHNLFHII